LFRVWEGGMAFHGGLLGVFLALIIYARKLGRPLGEVCDFVAPLAPIGLGLGRMANFINAELYGRATDVSWAMVFPSDSLAIPRHPSQLYQCFLEGVVLFVLIYGFTRIRRPAWAASGVFLLGYGVARYAVEFFREPDASLFLDWMTRGQFLSLPMIIGGAAMIALSYYYFNQNDRRFIDHGLASSSSNVKGVAKTAAKKLKTKKTKSKKTKSR
jgi:phosphatidylglycerol:prolipoprotein diacylglycerol transferase